MEISYDEPRLVHWHSIVNYEKQPLLKVGDRGLKAEVRAFQNLSAVAVAVAVVVGGIVVHITLGATEEGCQRKEKQDFI